MTTKPLATRTDLREALRRLGMEEGDVVMVHAGLRSVGPVLGGVNTVVQALLDAVGSRGTLMAYLDWEMGVEPEDFEDARLREEIPTFDKRIARATRDHGILAETLRTWPGAVRSDHPDAGMVAIGARAEWLCSEHPFRYGYGPGSPLARLVEAGGKVLMLGAPLEKLTLLHHAEHLADLPGKRVVRYQRPLLVNGERRWVDFEEFDTSEPVTDALRASSVDPFTLIGEQCLTEGIGRAGAVGQAPSHLFDARRLLLRGVAWLEAFPR
ncbi:aminoglycoside 3-N-acetyltransferase [Corallococcus macrosporus]|uniref:Aminoglycoside N(3)-acetyltransferase n=1 Tax=Corallococcus macrosporus TaxID=35 RepID=A0ABS3D4F2_9BACT|nr:aminoglycoside 3-N-acetyltransferase [Corallococcus macrosporus]MBN8226537.1 aminoglycoside 3-N-acetyltransferase [Corallococcus macrosporus]